MISGGGRSHGSIAMGDGLIRCPSTLPEIKARQSSSAPEIRPRERPVQLAFKVSYTYSAIFLHCIVCASINDYKWSCEWCCRLLYRLRENGETSGGGGGEAAGVGGEDDKDVGGGEGTE